MYRNDQPISEYKQGIEHERQRIARDLHDGVVQRLVAVMQRLDLTQRLLEDQKSQQAIYELQNVAALVTTSLEELHTTITTLRPLELTTHSLDDALMALLQETEQLLPGIQIQSQFCNLQTIPPNVEIVVFRIVQEALANIRKHAHASQAIITITNHNQQLLIEIRDNGDGLQQSEQQTGHFGLHTMQERVKEISGDWHVESQTGQGTTIRANIPLNK
ncbi:MAG TPA: sensor histidine kinase [Dictyobacter sp.]|jgi:signal transduction histidine kinase|nr:sensor histidine kinase [Dictyobacter sp.]